MKREHIFIGFAAIILGALIASQFKYVQSAYLSGVTPTQRTNEIILELQQAKSEKEELAIQYDALSAKLSEIESKVANESDKINQLTRDLEKYRLFAGVTEVVGPGIEVTVNNPIGDDGQPLEKNIVYDYEMILKMINELNSAGAEAISINDQRMVTTSEIRAAGSAINVNTIPLNPPYIIKAIGSNVTLENALNQRFGVVSLLRDQGYYVDVKKLEIVEVKAFTGRTRFQYAETVKD